MRHTAFVLLPIAFAALAATSASGKSTSLTLLYTASAQGQIRSCNCTKFRFGGYGRELSLLKTIRGQCPDSILVEGGDLVEWTGFQARLKTEVAGRAMRLLGYQALVPGENEIGRPGDRSIHHFDPKSVPIVCANFTCSPPPASSASGRDGRKVPPFSVRPYVLLKTRSGLKVAVVGLIGRSVGRAFQEEDFRRAVSDPVEALRRILPQVRPKCDLAVVVYHGPVAEAEKLAIKGVDLVLAAHRSTREVLFPEKPANEIEAPVRSANGAVIIGAETHENWSLGRVDLDLDSHGRIALARHKLIYLDRHYPEAPAMLAVYEDYNRKVEAAVLSAAGEFRSKAEAMLAGRGLNLVEMRKRLRKSPFATAERCKTCHTQIHESWSKTRHAHAMATLERTHQDYDPECITCHATGVLARNGFTNRRDTPDLANVQCEACHGPGLAHAESPAKGYGKVEEQTCRSCHTDERTPEFDFETAREKIKH